jgi:dTDP-4-dehydrorhamnose 3,5-epimerase-like enzyme
MIFEPLEIILKKYTDERGFFIESFNKIVQDKLETDSFKIIALILKKM